MSLVDQMYQRLRQASLEAELERSNIPSGLRPMSKAQGQEVLRVIQTRHPEPPKRVPLRPMTMDQGATIHQILTGAYTVPEEQPITPQSSLQSIIKRLRKQ